MVPNGRKWCQGRFSYHPRTRPTESQAMSTADVIPLGNDEPVAFSDDEIAAVLSDFGISPGVQAGQSYRSAIWDRVRVETSEGQFLLARYRLRQSDVPPIEELNELHAYLLGRDFPVLRFRQTASANEPATSWRRHIYRLCLIPNSSPYSATESATRECGRVLGWMHQLLLEFNPSHPLPSNSYHTPSAAEDAFAHLLKN